MLFFDVLLAGFLALVAVLKSAKKADSQFTKYLLTVIALSSFKAKFIQILRQVQEMYNKITKLRSGLIELLNN